MDNNEILKSVYNDFFNTSYINEEERLTKKEEQIEECNIDINSLYLTDQSKKLLNKIVGYMKLYSEEKEKNYISFNISLDSEDNETINNIIDVLKFYSKKYNYVKNNNVNEFSFYKISKEDEITKAYNDGIVVLKNLDAINMQDTNFQKKFFYLFIESLNDKNITIINDSKEKINEFYKNNSKLESEYFIFKLEGIKPSVNDIYNEILTKIDNINENNEFNIKLLDYITNDYPKSSLDSTSYINNLYKYISFNKEVPALETIKSNEEVFKDLNELIGLDKVKKSLYDLVDLITLKNKTQNDLKINNINLHMVFLGNPGTGKTTVARMISNILYNLKYISENKLIEVSSKDLVAEYVGQTSPKTMAVVEKALGGVLFIDEAYALADDGTNTYNKEAIATLIKAMEDYRDRLVVIFAGYTKEMQDFLNSNSGIVSRIGYTLEFDDYTTDELVKIFKLQATKSGFIIEDDAISKLEDIINENRNTKNFGNARFVRNVFEKTVIKHATNTKNYKQMKKLKTLTKEDITL